MTEYASRGTDARLSVLMSSYSCEPGKGSEPEVGWQWAIQMARRHDVTVLTRKNNEPIINEHLSTIPEAERPRFVYHDLGAPWLAVKRTWRAHAIYYRRWQAAAWHILAALVAGRKFDLLHHVTYAGIRFPVAILGHGIPTLWGPVGGMEATPFSLLPFRHPRELLQQGPRTLANRWMATSTKFANRLRSVSLVLASTKETETVCQQLGVPVRLMPTIGIHAREFRPKVKMPGSSLKLLFAGRLLWLKGIEFALHAMRSAPPNVSLTVIGGGPFEAEARKTASRLGLGDRISFQGQIPRTALLDSYADFDALIFPSLHDSGAFTVLEAMACGLPVICLDAGGPALAVAEGCGMRVPLGSFDEVVSGLSQAIGRYAQDLAACSADGERARGHVEAIYDWDRKAEEMSGVYWEVVNTATLSER